MDSNRDLPPHDDLRTLAWIQEELRRSLDTSNKALHRFLREAEGASISDFDDVDPAILHSARRQIHQSAGALELIGVSGAAQLLQAAEAALQGFVLKPHKLDAPAVETLERAFFAVLDYVSRLLAGYPVSPVALFPQYRAVQQLAGAERVHPADLWHFDWQWIELPEEPGVRPRAADAAARAEMEQLLLTLMRQAAPLAAVAGRMSELCAALGAQATTLPTRSFWRLSAAFFQGQGRGLLPNDIYTKRVASRVLAQFGRGESEVSERLAQDLLFFCAQCQESSSLSAPRVEAVRRAYGLMHALPVNYEEARLGRFDPALLTQARKRVAAAKDSWAAAAGGELHRVHNLREQFALVGDSLCRLYPGGQVLADALQQVAAQTVHAQGLPSTALAMEVATSVLYLEASLEEAGFEETAQVSRMAQLARRILTVRQGQAPEPNEPWMEALYRRVSDRQTLGSVAQELRASLGEAEADIDRFFRSPADASVLQSVPAQFASMPGVLSVLGLRHAARSVGCMCEDIDLLLGQGEGLPEAQRHEVFDRLACNLSALGFLVDALGVQPNLAKDLFVFDERARELRPLVQRLPAGEEAASSAEPKAASVEPGRIEPAPSERAPQVRPVQACAESAVAQPVAASEPPGSQFFPSAPEAVPFEQVEGYVDAETGASFLEEIEALPDAAALPVEISEADFERFFGTGGEGWIAPLPVVVPHELPDALLEEERPGGKAPGDALAGLASQGFPGDPAPQFGLTIPGLHDELEAFGGITAEVDFALPQAPDAAESVDATRTEGVFLPVTAPVALPTAAMEGLVPVLGVERGLQCEEPEDDLDAEDDVHPDLFPIFEEEAAELLPQLSGELREWLQQPEEPEAARACMRTLHTLKGSARLAGALRLGELAHRLETCIENLASRRRLERTDVEPLQARIDELSATFEALRFRDAQAYAEASALSRAREGQHQEKSTVAVEVREEAVSASFPQAAVAPHAAAAGEPATQALPCIDWSRFTRGGEAPRGMAASAQHSVRVRAPLLDRLVSGAGEVSVTRARLEEEVGIIRNSTGDLADNLERLRQHLRDIELQAETHLSARVHGSQAEDGLFDPLEFDCFTRFQELTRLLAESVNDVQTVQRTLLRSLQAAEDELALQARLTRELEGGLLRTRMVEFEALAERFHRVVRQTAKGSGKQARLEIVGGLIEVDRGVLDRMTAAFEHLLRNAVTHGIEPPWERLAAGKDPTGTVRIVLQHEGNEVRVEFRDDGSGLNLARIRERAVASGRIAAEAQLSDEALAELIFLPGLSTAEAVTELAGRGVGLDVVRSEVNAMGGRIETATAAGRGMSICLVLPLTMAVSHVVILRCGKTAVGVPANLIEIVLRGTVDGVARAHESGSYSLHDQALPFYWLGALLQTSGRSQEAPGRSIPVVIVRSAGQRVALQVDEVLGHQEVVVKNLGPQLSHLPGLAGMALLASGAVGLIYNPVALAAVYGQKARALSGKLLQPSSSQEEAPVDRGVAAGGALVPLVLVVDDSLTVRRVTQRLLRREGYRVALAKDGLDALERLAEERPAVVLSAIEMPRMDGFDLVRNLRSDPALAEVPVIMITSRIAQKHRDCAAELRVDHYLGKPYSEDELLGLIAQHCRAPETT